MPVAEHKPPEEEDGNQLRRDPYSFFKKMVEVQIYTNLYSMDTQHAKIDWSQLQKTSESCSWGSCREHGGAESLVPPTSTAFLPERKLKTPSPFLLSILLSLLLQSSLGLFLPQPFTSSIYLWGVMWVMCFKRSGGQGAAGFSTSDFRLVSSVPYTLNSHLLCIFRKGNEVNKMWKE